MKKFPPLAILILFGISLYAQKAIPKNWYQLDPAVDSLAGISLDKAYNLLKGLKPKPVIVAVIDNGVDIAHEDLKNQIWTNSREIPGNGIDDDYNGFVDDTHGWNFRGAKDGTVIANEQTSSTQLYKAWKSKFEHIDTAKLKSADLQAYHIYQRAKQDYLSHQNSKDSTERQ